VHFDVVTCFDAVLTSVHPAVGYAFGATRGAARRRPPETPRAFGGSCIPPVETTKVAVAGFVFFEEHGPLPLVISSQDTVLVAVVRSFTGANHTRGVRFIERFAEPGGRRSLVDGLARPAAATM